MTCLADLTVSELADGICLRAGRIAAAQAELLSWIGEFDRREGWVENGMLSCAHWLSWRISLSPSAAREQVRVARCLQELPAVAAAFAEGAVSYSKVRAITRAAVPDDGIDWVGLGRQSSGAQLEKIARGIRRARANEAARLDPEAALWSLRTRTRYDDNGNFILTISGPGEFLPVLQAGIEAKRAELQRHRDAQVADEIANETVRPPAAAAEPEPEPEPEPELSERRPTTEWGASAEAPKPAASAEAAEPAAADADRAAAPPVQPVELDEQAPGWPAGTTWRDVRGVIARFVATQQRLREDDERGVSEDTDEADPPTAPDQPAAVTPPAAPAGTAAASAEAPDAPASTEAPQAPAGTAGASAEAPEALDASAEASKRTVVSDAEALLALAQDALAAEQSAHPATARRRRPQLTAQIDPLSGWARQLDGELLPPSSLRQVLKTLPGRHGIVRLRPVTTADLHRHDLGRSHREATTALRELLGTLDGERCRFPGCTRRKNLHAHHVLYWSDGGRTDLDNLVLVCARHHTLIHTQGFALRLHPDRRLDVHTPDGAAILHHPAHPWGDPAALAHGRAQHIAPDTLQPEHAVDRIDLGYVVNVLLAQAS
jgi:Domain of unknown function (DUF222)/HNH endonuclease